MNRIRVSELAKELGLETKAILAQFNKLGIQVKNHLSMVNEGDISKLKAALHPSGKQSEKDSQQKTASKIFIRRKVLDTTPSVQEPTAVNHDSAVHATAATNEIQLSVENEPLTAKENLVSETQSLEMFEQEQIPTKLPEENFQVPFTHEATTALPVQQPLETIETQTPTPVTSQESEASQTLIDSKTALNEKALNTNSKTPENTDQTISQANKSPISSMPSRQTFTQRSNQNSPSSQPTGTAQGIKPGNTTKPAPTPFTGATIVRRAPETSNVYQVRMTRPQQGGTDSYQQSYGNRRPPSSDNRFQSRPPQGNTQTNSGGGRFPQKAFIMPDSLPATPLKEPSSAYRSKEHKDREKQRRNAEEMERANKNARAKGTRFYEEDDDLNLNLDNIDGASENTINVRTIISPKKRRPSAFKRKEHTEPHLSNPTKASKKIIRIDSHISVNDLASELSQKVAVVIKTLLKLGMFATANKVLDFDTATLIAQEFGYETQNVSVSLEDIIAQKNTKQQEVVSIEQRPPIITIMGHVDHGKTSLLDALRKTNVVASEAGGITQHIGAYQIEYQNRKLTFLDTPGHEAFTSMRARGAQVTDIVILVVAADDGVMPQTIEAIAHAKAANVPTIVAINKIDKPNINVERIVRELSEHGVISEEWGGDSIFVQVSAKTGKGLDQLIESILLQADVLELKAPINGFAEGVVIEARRDKSRGPVATVIVTKGTLKQQDSIVIGKTMGRVRAMYSDNGTILKDAVPGTPVELIGLDDVPDAGDIFNAVASDAIAREAVAYRTEKHRQAVLASQKPISTNDLMALFAQQESSKKTNELSIIIKADTHGSAEAIKASLQKLDTEKVKNKVVLAAVGGITETDIVLADASRALVLGFNVRPDKIAAQRAEATGIKIMFFNIIYELIEAVKVAMAGTLAPIKQDKIIGHAEIRNLFTVPKVGVIAGSLVTDGKIVRPCRLRVVRDGIVQYTGQLGSLKRFKEDAKEVMHGFECGIGVENYNDLKVGDVLEAYVIEEIAAEL